MAPGDTITIYGHWYTTTCNDTGGHDPLRPPPLVHLTLRLPGGVVEDLGPVRSQRPGAAATLASGFLLDAGGHTEPALVGAALALIPPLLLVRIRRVGHALVQA